MSTERESVMDYLWTRILKAWERGDMDEAQDCARFHEALDAMTDDDYHAAYWHEAVAS